MYLTSLLECVLLLVCFHELRENSGRIGHPSLRLGRVQIRGKGAALGRRQRRNADSPCKGERTVASSVEGFRDIRCSGKAQIDFVSINGRGGSWLLGMVA